ncbi:hypothetical protein GCM10027436_81760 [Actinophytocola sediminis]
MSPWVSAIIEQGPWVFAIVVASKIYRLALTWMVRTGRSDIVVDDRWSYFKVRRGRPDSLSESPPGKRGLRSIDGGGPKDDPPEAERVRSG